MAAAVESEQVLSKEYVVHVGQRVYPGDEREAKCVICSAEVTEGDFAIESVLRKCRTRQSRARVACYDCAIDYAKRYQQKRVESKMVLLLSDAWTAHSMKSTKGSTDIASRSETLSSGQRRVTDNGSEPCSGDTLKSEIKKIAVKEKDDLKSADPAALRARDMNRTLTDAPPAPPPGSAMSSLKKPADKERDRSNSLDIATIGDVDDAAPAKADEKRAKEKRSEGQPPAPLSGDTPGRGIPAEFSEYDEALLGVPPLPPGSSMRQHSRTAPAVGSSTHTRAWDGTFSNTMPLPTRPYDSRSGRTFNSSYPTSSTSNQRTPESSARYYQQARTNAYANARFGGNSGSMSLNLSSLSPGVISPIYPTRSLDDLARDGPRPSARPLHGSSYGGYPLGPMTGSGGGPRLGPAQATSGDYNYGGSAAADDQSGLGFLVVTQLVKTGAADQAGLHVGDIFLKFGSITKQNFPGLKSLADIVRQSAGAAIPAVVLRRMEACVNDNGQPMVFDAPVLQKIHLTLRPLQSQDVRGGGVLGAVINTWPLPEPVKYH